MSSWHSWEGSHVELLSNEVLFHVFQYLDASSLIAVSFVNQHWNSLCSELEQILWRHLCFVTQRISGNFTLAATEKYAEKHGWKSTYYWIKLQDLRISDDPQQVCDCIERVEKDALKKNYLYSRALEFLPNAPAIPHAYADFLADAPDENGSWRMALSLYNQAISMARKELKSEQNRKTLYFALYKCAQFLANNLKDVPTADRCFRRLVRLLPSNSWVLEKYAEFLSELRHKHNLAEKIYRVILNIEPTGSALASYALFLWQVRKNYTLAAKCFKVASEVDMERSYFLSNFYGRHVKDEEIAKEVLKQSKLAKVAAEHPEDVQATFSLALAYHQIHCVDEAEALYRTQLQLQPKYSVCTLSNLAELLAHARFNFKEAEELYLRGLEMASGAHETIQVALCGLHLAMGRIEEGLAELDKLLMSSYIQASRNTYTEGWILFYIHCGPERKREALTQVKRQLVTEGVRPKLILMFEANIRWAQENIPSEAYWVEKLCAVYNCAEEVTVLETWDDWVQIEVPLPPQDDETVNLSKVFEEEGNDDIDNLVEECHMYQRGEFGEMDDVAEEPADPGVEHPMVVQEVAPMAE